MQKSHSSVSLGSRGSVNRPEPLDIQGILKAASDAEALLEELQGSPNSPVKTLEDFEQDPEFALPPTLSPQKWAPVKEYFPVPATPLALSPTKYKASLTRTQSIKKALKQHQEASSRSLHALQPAKKISPFSRINKGPGKPSKEASRRAATAPALSGTAPGRYVSASQCYSDALGTHTELRNGTRATQDAYREKSRINSSLQTTATNSGLQLANLQKELETLLLQEAAVDTQLEELKSRLGEEAYRVKSEEALQERYHAPCRRMDEAEVAALVVKLETLRGALSQCEDWRYKERKEHKQTISSNISKVMHTRMKIQEMRNELKQEEAKLAAIHAEHLQAQVSATNFFLRDGEEGVEMPGGIKDIGDIIESSMQSDGANKRVSGPAADFTTLFDAGGPESLLERIEPLPDIRRLMALQSISTKFAKYGKEVASVQRALEAAESTSSSQLDQALEGIIHLTQDVLNCNIVSIYKVDEANGVMRGMAPEHIIDFTVPLGQGLVGYTALSNSILRASDAARHPSFSREHEDYVPEGRCSCICIPVTGTGRPQEKPMVYGVLKVMGKVGFDGPVQVFSQDDISILRWVGREIYQIMHNCQRFSESVKKVQIYSSHMRATMELCLRYDQKGVMVLAAQRIAEMLEAECAVVYFLDRSSNELVGYTNGKKPQMVRRPLQGLLGEVFNHGDIRNFKDVRKQQHFVPHIDQPPGVKVETSMLVTMHSAMLATIGLIQVCNKRQSKSQGAFAEKTFTHAEEELLAHLAKDVSVAIENGRMLRQAQERRLGLYGLKIVNTQLDSLRQITYNLRDSLKCEHAKVVLVDEDAQQLMVPDFSSRRYIHYPVGKGIVGTVVTNKEIIKVSEDKEWMGDSDRVDSVGVAVTSMICGAAKDAVSGKIIAVLQAVNKRRAAAFDMLDEKRMEVLTQKAAFLLRNADLHDTQHRYEYMQRMLAEKFGALLGARNDKFRFVQAIEELCFDLMHPDVECHFLLTSQPDSVHNGKPYFPVLAGNLSLNRKISVQFAEQAIEKKEVVVGMKGDLSSFDEHTGESILPMQVAAHPLFEPTSGELIGVLVFQREAIQKFQPIEDRIFKIMAERVGGMYQQMLANVERASIAQAQRLAAEHKERVLKAESERALKVDYDESESGDESGDA